MESVKILDIRQSIFIATSLWPRRSLILSPFLESLVVSVFSAAAEAGCTDMAASIDSSGNKWLAGVGLRPKASNNGSRSQEEAIS